MAYLTASNIMTPESSNCSGIISPSANMSPPQSSTLQSRMVSGPVSILWDIENCPVPSDVRPEDVAGNIRMALRVHPVITGAVTLFSAYGDFNAFPRRLREGCQRTGVKLVDVPNGRKDAADKAILVDMFLFALDNPPPSSILLISGDVDFAPALHILGQRGYTVILVIPARVDVSSALTNAGRFVWDWPSVARGEGFVPPKYLIPRVPNLACYFSSSQIGDNTEGQYEESIVYTGISRGEYSARGNLNQMHFNSMSVVKEPSRGLPPMPESGNHPSSVPCAPPKAQSLPCGVVVDRTQAQDQSSWVHPGDIQGLRGQLIKLLEMFGGSLALVRVPPEYLRKYGRPLYVAEYGVLKLVNLINKIGSPLSVVGKGHNKMVCLRNVADKQINSCLAFARKNAKGKGGEEDIPVDIGICRNMSSSSDDFSDEEKIEMVGNCGSSGTLDFYSHHLNSFRQELQELLVCYSCRVLFTSFEALYEQRYKKRLDYRSFGVDGLDNLIKKVSDVVELCEEPGTKRKIIVSSFASG